MSFFSCMYVCAPQRLVSGSPEPEILVVTYHYKCARNRASHLQGQMLLAFELSSSELTFLKIKSIFNNISIKFKHGLPLIFYAFISMGYLIFPLFQVFLSSLHFYEVILTLSFVFLSLLAMCWDYQCVPPCLTQPWCSKQ